MKKASIVTVYDDRTVKDRGIDNMLNGGIPTDIDSDTY